MSARGAFGLLGGFGLVLGLALGQVTGVIGSLVLIVLACRLRVDS